jgi:hypothetical protein
VGFDHHGKGVAIAGKKNWMASGKYCCNMCFQGVSRLGRVALGMAIALRTTSSRILV